jgi:hypothetical protein
MLSSEKKFDMPSSFVIDKPCKKQIFMMPSHDDVDKCLSKLLDDYLVIDHETLEETLDERVARVLAQYPRLIYDYGQPSYFRVIYPRLPDEAYEALSTNFSHVCK